MTTEKSGKLSNGLVWTWQFGGRVDLLDASRERCVMVTYLNTTNYEPFEDEVWDKTFDPMFCGDKKLCAEYEVVCWECYLAEYEIVDKTYACTKDRALVALNKLRDKTINYAQFNDILADIIDTIKVKEGWDSEGDEYWLIGSSGVLTDMIVNWLEDYLETYGFELV